MILASSSPRRRELLKNAGLSFDVVSPDTTEELEQGETPRKMVLRLANEKAHTIAASIHDLHGIIIAADTTVVSPHGLNLGKPTNMREALKMLKLILGQKHSVMTAYSILEVKEGRLVRKWSRTVLTKVKMRHLTPRGIHHYVSLGESMDKAGAYAAQGYGMNLIESISGSYTNVVGLPMAELIEDLRIKFKYPCPF